MRGLIIALTFSVLFSQSTEKIYTLNEPVGDINSIKVNIDFGMGSINLERGQSDLAVTGYLKFNRKYTDALFEYEEFGATGVLDVETDFDLDWSDKGKKDDDKSNESEIYLTPDIPLKMSIDVGFGEGNFNFDELQISELVMDCGLGESNVVFGQLKNKIACKRVDIDNGLGSISISKLANANTGEMEFECGLGSMILDFSGEIDQDIEVDLAVGMGTINIYVPDKTNVIFEYDGTFLSSIDLDSFKKLNDKEYQSEEFTPDQPTITFSATIGAGSVTLNWLK